MLLLLSHILMFLGASIAIVAVGALWILCLIAVFDEAAQIETPLIRNIINKIEEYRNARS